MNCAIGCVVAWCVLTLGPPAVAIQAAEARTSVETASERESPADPKLRERAATGNISGDVRIDLSTLKSAAWKEAIRKATEYPGLRAGGQVSLLRVLHDDAAAKFSAAPSDEAPVVVNGVRLYLPVLPGLIDRVELAAFFEATPAAQVPRPAKIQLQSIKLVRFEEFPNGGGMYQELSPGEFVLVEHINSTRRESGRDPLAIGSFTHQHAELGIPVPPRGQLGIVGDIVLSRPKDEALGRVVAEVVSSGDTPLEVRHFRIGPVVVGGRYGGTFAFNEHGLASTGRISPGQYRILLPDFDMVKSRWDVTVRPGEVTYLRFNSTSPKEVQLQRELHLSFDDEN